LTTKSFAPDEDEAYFIFDLQKDLQTSDLDFAISVSQLGERLKKYRLKENPWNPSRFNIALMSTNGKLIKSTNGDKFLTSLVVD